MYQEDAPRFLSGGANAIDEIKWALWGGDS